MEEILASIRRIIADDQEEREALNDSLPAEERVLNRAEPQIFSSDPHDDFPELAERRPYRVEMTPVGETKLQKPESPVEDVPEPVRPSVVERSAPAETAHAAILSDAASHSISEAFSRLGSANPAPVTSNAPRTIDDIVKEMLRPMLKAWLDENLPPIVERVVRDEIERATRGRR